MRYVFNTEDSQWYSESITKRLIADPIAMGVSDALRDGVLIPTQVAKDTFIVMFGLESCVFAHKLRTFDITLTGQFQGEWIIPGANTDSNGQPGPLAELKLKYRCPEGTHLLLMAERPSMAACLVMRDDENGTVYKPFLPNVYDDGKICTGSMTALTGRSSDPMLEWFDTFKQLFLTARFNTDLGRPPVDWFKFNAETLQQFQPTTSWKEAAMGTVPERVSFRRTVHLLNMFEHQEDSSACNPTRT